MKVVPGVAKKLVSMGGSVSEVINSDSDRKAGLNAEDRYGRPGAHKGRAAPGQRRGENAELTETPEFKEWFGKSTVVFKEGEADYFQNPGGVRGVPRMVYHGTNSDSDFDIFRPAERGAIWFRSDPTAAARVAGKHSAVIPAFLRIENPVELGSEDCLTMGAAIEEAKTRGNDGVIFDYGNGDYIYTVFSRDQVKSPLAGDASDAGDEAGGGPQNVAARNCREPQREYRRQRCRNHRPGRLKPTSAMDVADSTIGRQFQQIEKQTVPMTGLRIGSHADLAVFATGCANPDYEEIRYVYVRRTHIVDHEKVACPPPGYLKARVDFDQYVEHLAERIRTLGATAVYMVHNRPNGNPQPGEADVRASSAMAMSIPQYRGQIIINSSEFGYRDPTVSDPVVKAFAGQPGDWADPIGPVSVPHELLRRKVDSVEDIAAWARPLTMKRDAPLLIYIGSAGQVRGLQEIHPCNFSNIALMRNRMPRKLVDFGSVGACAVLPENPAQSLLDALRYYVKARVLRAGVGFHGASAYYFC
ncbi:MAG: hypothetical protein P4L55_21615 [Syntrophobacteraceae bacterium]|nr:hypothetical protein [Syntrophobacteraceae bacterium]